MKKFFLTGSLLGTMLTFSYGQGAYLPFDRDNYHLIERYEIKKGELSPVFHTGFKPYRRADLATYFEESIPDSIFKSKSDLFNQTYFLRDNWEFYGDQHPESRKSWGGIYETPADFYFYRDSVFDVHLDPVIYFRGGLENGAGDFRFRNTRGLALRGSIDRKIGFYTYLSTTDLIFPSWVRDYAQDKGAVPGEGFWKRYGEGGYSFFSAMGHVTFQATPHIAIQAGHDRNFVGEGYRSLILSDFSNPYVFVKVNTKIWKLNFTNLWAQMNADIDFDRGFPTDGRYPQKWFSHHRLGVNLGKKLNIGIFESIMANQVDWNYFNPLIFYRWVEHQLGSPDKVMIGTDFKWNFTPGMQLYGQFVLDEFVFNEFFGIDGRNSSRNKHGVQIGYKYLDVAGVSNLDWQLEYNQVRPFTYQEKFEYQSFSNYRTPLTHPLGANFREAVSIWRYQPFPKLQLHAHALLQIHGQDFNEEDNFGGDVLKGRTSTSTGLFGNYIGQGNTQKIWIGAIRASYMWKHNVFLDLSYTYRDQHSVDDHSSVTASLFQGALRMNFQHLDFLF
ncbi:hypothetical protein [Pleomorphovibrio marinus]|uniref:hypothetical protein n=1 Tax=Pleomorphovibrio marinus TaxID=2164132 RepID=UPI000E0A183B|nr:hypothetical protein [Pleomorphovibrio marinus]